MRAVVQRVSRASVSWTENPRRQPGGSGQEPEQTEPPEPSEPPERTERTERIGPGLTVLLGAGPEDRPEDADRLADKVAQLRIFRDSDGRFNRSLEDVGGEVLVVSQFTLYADTRRGRRPSFIGAAEPECARQLCQRFANRLSERGLTTRSGSFGASMLVSLDNDGPVTIVLSTDPWETRISG
jgi:D-tyrosyl-tRNA(Tyr) deacylase